jgi:hypothetical protein
MIHDAAAMQRKIVEEIRRIGERDKLKLERPARIEILRELRVSQDSRARQSGWTRKAERSSVARL